MTEVFIAGVGQTPVGELWEISLRDLAVQAIVAARQDAGGLKPEAMYVGNMLAPLLSDQAHLGSLIADHAGLKGIEAAVIEAGGASGGAALRSGYMAVASGDVETALVLGVEKFTDRVGPKVEAAVATGTDSDFESVQGLTPTEAGL
jgi:acetyl-CoA C-acetyltransferase